MFTSGSEENVTVGGKCLYRILRNSVLKSEMRIDINQIRVLELRLITDIWRIYFMYIYIYTGIKRITNLNRRSSLQFSNHWPRPEKKEKEKKTPSWEVVYPYALRKYDKPLFAGVTIFSFFVFCPTRVSLAHETGLSFVRFLLFTGTLSMTFKNITAITK